ncbi:hypothetical protein [Vibrio sp. SCSIO 43136]|uniref:hypothetical protein n=1 Tax=Vibrio sp. SCSIO 43136 TaxID=2819101 RepID=UPI0020754F25|nr:hypothetical protein [Vibrio sp. SCSIO 43136]USD66473.1 hypothetical protein J4N39_06600 [Vibrio sp. SCSIO 43136]
MIRLLAIAALLVLAVLLFKYRTNEKLQKGVVTVAITGFVLYVIYVVTMELIR